eukprot:scaffold10261_cov248-Ochromonas_danica.AAC.2
MVGSVEGCAEGRLDGSEVDCEEEEAATKVAEEVSRLPSVKDKRSSRTVNIPPILMILER